MKILAVSIFAFFYFSSIGESADDTSTSDSPKNPSQASANVPFENSLGMRFSSVPITGGPTDGKHILFSIWETRVQDYRQFIAENESIKWTKPSFEQEDDHPAVFVRFEDAEKFCIWLTKRDLEKGLLKVGQNYRLPTDHEWSCAIGIGELEDPLTTPESKNKKVNKVWPWGNSWPPPAGALNLFGEEVGDNFPGNGKPKNPVKGYNDGFQRTAPAGSFPLGKNGLFEMSGNVSEWVSDWYSETKERRVMRSASWTNTPSGFFLSSARGNPQPSANFETLGFRPVLDLNEPAPPRVKAVPTPLTETNEPAPTMDKVPESPLAAIPGLEPRLIAYLEQRKNSIESLSIKYLNALDSRFDAAIQAGDLDLAQAFRNEKEEVAKLKKSLDQKNRTPFQQIESASTLADLPESAPEGLLELRAIWSAERGKVRSELSAYMESSLNALEVELTKAADLDNATKVKKLNETLKAKTDQPLEDIEPEMTQTEALPKANSNTTLFENSLGMKFTPVRGAGKPLLYSIWETRIQDYEEFIKDVRNRQWKKPDFRQKDDHPALMVTYEDAIAFCEWLTEEERARQIIGKKDRYDLPTGDEFRLAVGAIEIILDEPQAPAKRYLWGDEWPPSSPVGNFYGTETEKEPLGKRLPIGGYNDGFTRTSPAGQFPPNSFGIYDLAGNAAEWCRDYISDEVKLRFNSGGAWSYSGEASLRATFQNSQPESFRGNAVGFRPVLRRANK